MIILGQSITSFQSNHVLTEKTWTIWKSTINKCYQLRQGEIANPLEYWNDCERDQWKWFYHDGTNNLYQCVGRMWKLYKRANRRGRLGRRPTFRYNNNVMALPPG